MVASALFFFLQIGSGVLLFRWLDPERRWSAGIRSVAAAVVGMTVSGYVVLVLTVLLRALLPAVFISAALMSLALIVAYRKGPREVIEAYFHQSRILTALRSPTFWITAVIISIAVALEIQILLPATPFVRAQLNAWGDAAFHLSLIERLRTASPFVLEHPVFSGHALTYPFLSDFLSSMYRVLGAPVFFAYHLPAVTLLVCALILLFAFYRLSLRRSGLAALGVALAIFGAGVGWLWLGKDAQVAFQQGGVSRVMQMFRQLPHEYTSMNDRSGAPDQADTAHNIVWIVPVLSFLTHQRAFPLGVALGTIVLLGAVYYRRTKYFARYGVIAGLLPLSHGHTFLALAILFFGLLLSRWREWRWYLQFAVAAIIIAAPALLYLRAALQNAGATQLFAWWWGWMTCTHQQHWFVCDTPAVPGTDTSVIWFWVKNFGGVFVAWLVIAASAMVAWLQNKWTPEPDGSPSQPTPLPLLLPSALLFVIPNVVRFQPWDFDNNKILFWWWILAIGLVLHMLVTIRRRWLRVSLVMVFSAIVLAAGATDVWFRLASYSSKHFSYVGNAEVDAAQWIQKNIPPNAGIITGTSANQFVPLLTGRPIALGYEGWLWSEGVEYAGRRRAIEALAQGNPEPVCAEGLRYVVADADFLSSFNVIQQQFLPVVSPLWSQRTANGTRTIYQISCSVK